ncbi:myomegalin [Xenentodon cancila]
MLDVVKMKEACRICARELCGNQRRWIFHQGAKLNLQVLLSHVLTRDGRGELIRDGRGEFVCSKCTFMLERMYRFDTVIARVEALSLERLHKLLLEKERLRQCIGGLYRRNNREDGSGVGAGSEECPVVDLSALHDVRYSNMIQEDLAFSVYESWADKDEPALDQHQCAAADPLSGQKPRRCRGCTALRVADSDYEAVCKVPRRIGQRSTSCGPTTRMEDLSRTSAASEAATIMFEVPSAATDTNKTTCEQRTPSPASSVESLDPTVDVTGRKEPEEAPQERGVLWEKPPTVSAFSGLENMLGLLQGWEYRPVKIHRGSKLPVLVKTRLEQDLSGVPDVEPYPQQATPEVVVSEVIVPCPQQELQMELLDMEEQWLDDYIQCGPFLFQQELIGEQQDRFSQYESATGLCVSELQKAQNQVCSLQAKIRQSEARNQKLQEQLAEMELELRSAREEALKQERNTQNLTDNVNSKDAEAAELYRVIDEQNKMLCSLRQLADHSQLQVCPPQRRRPVSNQLVNHHVGRHNWTCFPLQVFSAEAGRGQSEVLTLQASLFHAQLELQAAQRAQQWATRAQEDRNRALDRLENDLQGALQHRREVERHNQELQMALQKVRAALQEREEQLREREHKRQREEEERENTIGKLRMSLQSKEQLLEEYRDMSDDSQEKKDTLLQKLRQRIKERDRALERAVDEKFCFLKEKEEETRRVQLLLREKDRDLERQRCVLANNEETITSLEVLIRGKVLELEQVSDAWRSIQRQQQDMEDRQSCILRERDSIIKQLQLTLEAQTQEAQDLRCSLLAQIHSAPGDVLEELRVRLQLKDCLFQEVLADRTRQAKEHQEQVQDLLGTICSRDQYIKDSASRLNEVVTDQMLRLQELRQQLSSGVGSQMDSTADLSGELQVVQEELRVALRRVKESQELSKSQAARLDALSRSLHTKDDIIRDLQKQLVDPSELQLVKQLTQEVQELRESLFLQGLMPDHNQSGIRPTEFGGGHQRSTAQFLPHLAPPIQAPRGKDLPTKRTLEPELSSEEDEDEEVKSEYMESVGEDESTTQSCGETELKSLTGVKHLVEQKLGVEKELVELKVQLKKAGFSSLSQIRKPLFSLRAENKDLKLQLAEDLHPDSRQSDKQKVLEIAEEEKEAELDVTIGEEEEEGGFSEQWDGWDGEIALSQHNVQTGGEEKSKKASREELLDPQDDEDAASPAITVRLQQKSRELQERLMVSEATVQAQAEQLKDYRELLTETTVQQDSKQIQVDLQDLGYETCGRSENEAEREDTSSPEFDDLEMCTSLDCGSQWWSTKCRAQNSAYREDVPSLQRLVEDLHSQLSRSQVVIRGLQSRLRSHSIASDYAHPTPRKVNWSFQALSSQTGMEDDEGWQSSDGAALASPRHTGNNLQELVSRVDALEDQLRKGSKKDDKEKSETWPGKFDTLIQAQARELSHLRQRLREGRGICNILTQHLGDTTKAFEELLRANDIDYYMGQSFREQLAQSSALAQQVGAKISGRDHSEDPEENTELLAIRLSKELQQKDKLIESLRAKLNQHHSQRSDTPCSSHALSDTTDQSDRISYVSDGHRSTIEDLELCSDADVASELGQEENRASARASTDAHCHHGNMSQHLSASPSITSSYRAQSCLSCPSMHCPSSPHRPQTAPVSICPSYHLPSFSTQRAPLPFHPHASNLQARYQGNGRSGFSLAKVQQELQMLQRQLGDSSRFSTPTPRPLQGFPFAPKQPVDCLPLSCSGFQSSPFRSNGTSSLDPGLGMKAGAGLLESSELWDMTFGARPARVGPDLSSGSSGYQSGTNHTGSELMKEHLREIRSLRQSLEDSIQTNNRLRQQLEERLACTVSEKGDLIDSFKVSHSNNMSDA